MILKMLFSVLFLKVTYCTAYVTQGPPFGTVVSGRWGGWASGRENSVSTRRTSSTRDSVDSAPQKAWVCVRRERSAQSSGSRTPDTALPGGTDGPLGPTLIVSSVEREGSEVPLRS